MGDYSKHQLFSNNNSASSLTGGTDLLLNNLNVRLGLIKGLQFLCSHFQVIIFNNYTIDPTDLSYKDGAERIKSLLVQSNITVDAIYSTNMKV